jgi:hypothetical protein
MAKEHSRSTDDEEGLAAEFVEVKDGGKSEDNLQGTSHTGGEKGCLGGREAELK